MPSDIQGYSAKVYLWHNAVNPLITPLYLIDIMYPASYSYNSAEQLSDIN